MWTGDDDLNEDGKPVRLYQPIPYGRKPAMNDLTCSFVGGVVAGSGSPRSSTPCDDDVAASPTIPSCATCNAPLHSLVQLHVPETKRTLQVFACNRLACVQGLFSPPTGADSTRITSSTNGTISSSSSSSPGDGDKDSSRDMLCYGGGGVVVCRRFAAVVEDEKSSSSVSHLPSSKTTTMTIDEKPTASTADWVVEEEDETKKSPVDNGNEWAVEEDGDDDGAAAAENATDDLESKLAAMETQTKKPANPNPKKVSTATDEKKQTPASSSSSHFPCLELYSIQEPPALRRAVDQDDVGMIGSGGGRGTDDRKIQQMLAKYMQEEEDQDLLAVLRGSGVDAGGGGKGVGGGERDERLSATDRALLTFSDRLKRSPRQVLRYAHGGAPLWSIPTIPAENQSEPKSKRRSRKPTNQQQQQQPKSKMYGLEKPVPPCSLCGTARVFELQLLPSLLHVLEVDKHTGGSSNGASNKRSGLDSAYQQGGMDWGNIAVYTCPNSACCGQSSTEEYCVVQDSIDERPTGPKRQMPQGDAIVQEDTKFEDDEDDEEVGGEDGMSEDEDEDGESW